jgi:DDE_Tnp_1-associated
VGKEERTMSANLIEQLKQVEDFRTTDGRRHPLWLVLLFVIMGTMNGASGYRACGDFVKRHKQELIQTFGLNRHGVPSYSTIRRVMMGVDFDKLVEKFNTWAKAYVELEKEEWCGMDGKSIRGTVENYDGGSQNFVSIVSVFAGKRGLVVGMNKFENKKDSEIRVVQELITALDLTGVVLTFDSLHCQKKLVS